MTGPRAAALVAGAELSYVSDYVSFVGADATGRVAFALDANRGYDATPPGRRAERLQAEIAYAVLHDERAGWVELSGVARYPHPGPDVVALPDSPVFRFAGSPDDGLRVTSAANDLDLAVEPLADRLVAADARTSYVMRSAAAVLRWRGRTLPGRVIYEGLASTAFNLLSRRSFSGLAALDFFYLAAGDGDLYLQSVAGTPMAGMAPQVGFASPPGAEPDADTVLRGLRLSTRRTALAPGLFRWPTAWSATWTGAGPQATEPAGRLELRTVSRTTVGRYGIAGFAMAVVTGTLTRPDGSTLPVYGLGELLAGGPVFRALAARPPR